jgi:hypothetical protein
VEFLSPAEHAFRRHHLDERPLPPDLLCNFGLDGRYIVTEVTTDAPVSTVRLRRLGSIPVRR